MSNTFLLSQMNFDKNLSKTYEGLMAQGNGYLHTRGSFEEGSLMHRKTKNILEL